MRRPDLVADCGSCAAVCCVAPAFDKSDDFALDKPAGVACPHLARDCRCTIHDDLVVEGFPGCAAYDCNGAGQRVTAAFPDDADARHAAFFTVRVVHELLALLTGARSLLARAPFPSAALDADLAAAVDALDAIVAGAPSAWRDVDLRPHRDDARRLLDRVAAALGGRRRAKLAIISDRAAIPVVKARRTG